MPCDSIDLRTSSREGGESEVGAAFVVDPGFAPDIEVVVGGSVAVVVVAAGSIPGVIC